jgi:hypothetical protein
LRPLPRPRRDHAARPTRHLPACRDGRRSRRALRRAASARARPRPRCACSVAGALRRESEARRAIAITAPRQRDWPLAAIRIDALGVDPGDDYWLAADPVTFVAGRADVRLAGPVTDLAADEAAAIVATLNAHFAGDGLAFVVAAPAAWFARSRAQPELATSPLDAAMHRPLRECLPRGADAPRWRRWQDEIQMLPHEHPVNLARERRGLVSANGSGSRRRLAPALRCGGDLRARGIALALAHAVAARPLPAVLDAARRGRGRALSSSRFPPHRCGAIDAIGSRRRGRRCARAADRPSR